MRRISSRHGVPRYDRRSDAKAAARFLQFGMNMTTALNVFAGAVVRERRIPFAISASETPDTGMNALQAFYALRAQAQANGVADMTIDQINEEIDKARRGVSE